MGNFVTVFDEDGNAIQLDHVDARDYLATGRYTSAPVDPAVAAARAAADEEVRKAAAKVMTAEKDGTAIREAGDPIKGAKSTAAKVRTKKGP